MKRSFQIILAAVILLITGIAVGILVENRIDFLNTNSHSSIETIYFNKVRDEHDRELVIRAFGFLPDELKGVLDYSIIPKVDRVEKGLWSGSYVGNKFPDGLYRVIFTADPNLYMDPGHNMIIIAIDLKDEDRMMILPID